MAPEFPEQIPLYQYCLESSAISRMPHILQCQRHWISKGRLHSNSNSSEMQYLGGSDLLGSLWVPGPGQTPG